MQFELIRVRVFPANRILWVMNEIRGIRRKCLVTYA